MASAARIDDLGRATADRGLEGRIQVGPDVFVRFRGRWEWYRTDARGYGGLEKFVCFVDDEWQAARLDGVLGRAFMFPAARYYPAPRAPRWAAPTLEGIRPGSVTIRVAPR